MAGKIRQMIDFILDQKAKDNPMMARVIKTKMILKGINPTRYTDQSKDDPAILAKLEDMMQAYCDSATPSATPFSTAPATSGKKAKVQTAFSSNPYTPDCVAEIKKQLADARPALVIFFASRKYAPVEISARMQHAFPGAQVFGCSTAGEIISGHMLSGAVVAMAFPAEAVGDARIEVVREIRQRSAIEQAFKGFSAHFGEPVGAMNPGRYVGLLLIDGLAGAEEGFMENLGDLTDVNFIGGSAGDDLKFSATHVYAGGKSYTNAAVLALLKPQTGFSFIKTQSFRNLGKVLQVTKADEAERKVLQFNGIPAAQAYAEALGVPVGQAHDRFMRNPVGLIVEGEPYVRSPQQIKDDAMLFYCGVKEGMELSLLESADIISDTRSALDRTAKQLGGISAVINFNCILRTLDLQQQNLSANYGKLFADIPTVGFSTYGEQYIGHINQTATMLAFG